MIALRSICAALAGAAMLAAPAVRAAAPIETMETPEGLEAWIVSESTIPMVAIEIAFEGGAALDPEGKEGVANFLSGMLDEGAGELETVAFSERARLLGLRYGFNASKDAFTVSAQMLTDNLEESVELLRLALTEPRFDEEPMRRVRGQILSGIRSDETDPRALASRGLFSAAFPSDPYGRPTQGTERSVASIAPDDLRAARERLLDRSGIHIGVVGDTSAEEIGPLLDRLLASLPETPRERLGPVDFSAPAGVAVEPFPAPQSTVTFGQPGPLRDDPDFMPLYVVNYILGGGGFSSRLTEEVREKRGLAYSTYSYLLPFDRAGVWLGGVATANDRVAESLEVIKAEWRRMAEEGPTADELDRAKRFLTGAYPLRFDGNDDIARILVGLQRDGLGPDYVEIRNDLVEAVTIEDARSAAAEWLKPDALSFVVVGQPEGLPVGQ